MVTVSEASAALLLLPDTAAALAEGGLSLLHLGRVVLAEGAEPAELFQVGPHAGGCACVLAWMQAQGPGPTGMHLAGRRRSCTFSDKGVPRTCRRHAFVASAQ